LATRNLDGCNLPGQNKTPDVRGFA
jgi:hypothetical protein